MQTTIDATQLNLIAQGHSAFQLLWSAVKLGVFTELSREPGLELSAIGSRVGLEPYACRVLLVGLAALGLVTKSGNAYRNAAITEERLVPGRSGYQGDILEWQAHIVYPGMTDFLSSLTSGRNVGLDRFAGQGETLYERLAATPLLEESFHVSMKSISEQANRCLTEALDFNRFAHVVDAGGGSGENVLVLARAFQKPRFTIVDLPTVCERARRNMATHGLADRVSFRAGDLRADGALPLDADAILYCHVFTVWSLEEDLALLRRTYDALPRGGSVVLFNMMGNDDDTGPMSTALGSCYFLAIATGRGMLHSWRDYEKILLEAGFAETERVKGLPLDHGIIVGTKR